MRTLILERDLLLTDLVPGRIYRSPSGRLCKLKPPTLRGEPRYMLVFSYLDKTGQREIADQFSLDLRNTKAIAALREVSR